MVIEFSDRWVDHRRDQARSRLEGLQRAHFDVARERAGALDQERAGSMGGTRIDCRQVSSATSS